MSPRLSLLWLLLFTGGAFFFPSTIPLSIPAVIAQTTETRQTEVERLLKEGIQLYRHGKIREALKIFEKALIAAREAKDRENEATSLLAIGLMYDNLGQPNQALEYYQQALTIQREIKDSAGEGTTLNNIGSVYVNLGKYSQALDYYQQALVIIKEVGNRPVEGTTLNNIGAVYDSLGKYSQALDYYGQALVIRKEVGDRSGEGTTLNNIGSVYRNLGKYSQALDYFQQALVIIKEVRDRSAEGGTLNNIGSVYVNLGKYSQALDYYGQALVIIKEVGNRPVEGTTLNNIGLVYDNLGKYSQALDYFQQALVISKEVRDRSGEGTTLNNIGVVYRNLGKYSQALDYFQQALVIHKEVGDRSTEGKTLNNIGAVCDKLGKYSQALDYYQQALVIRKEVGDRSGEGTTLNNIGSVYVNLGKYSQALDYYQQALVIHKEVGNRPMEGITLNNIGYVLETQKQPQLAIIFLKQSVNTFETIRKDIQTLSKEERESYTKTVEPAYRELADLLLTQDRIYEAQRVLDLLKVQELDDFLQDVRGNDNTRQGIPTLETEKPIDAGLNQILAKAVENGQELAKLNDIQKQNETLTPTQEKRRAELIKAQEQITDNFNKFLESKEVQNLIAKLTPETRTPDLVDELDKLIGLQDNLKTLNAVLLYPLILDDRVELILTTPNTPPIRRTVKVSKAQLTSTIIAFRQALKSPNSDATIPAKQLYDWLIKPIENDLKSAKVETIIYAPDGQLRYIPLAALYDGKDWLIQKYRVNNITAYSLTDFTRKNATEIRILAGALVTGSYNFTQGGEQFSFRGLKYAGIEVDNLGLTFPNILKLIDNAFNPDDTTRQMNAFTIIHLATHASVVVGKAEDSFILFGNGTPVSIKEIKKWSLKGVDLVVLSACETGLGDIKDGTGAEILGLGYQIERAGAKSVIASLWTVDDGGTQLLMNGFYNLLLSGKVSKIEALRQAQIAMIQGNETLLTENRGIRVQGLTATGNLQGKMSHPYYWAPFISIGNGL